MITINIFPPDAAQQSDSATQINVPPAPGKAFITPQKHKTGAPTPTQPFLHLPAKINTPPVPTRQPGAVVKKQAATPAPTQQFLNKSTKTSTPPVPTKGVKDTTPATPVTTIKKSAARKK